MEYIGELKMKIDPLDFNENIWKLIGKDWMLISAGTPENHNAMTASWGGCGVMFNKNIVWCVIRPQRYTKKFVDSNDYFTLSFFDESYKKALGEIYGQKSGLDTDKDAESGFISVNTDIPNTVTYREANLTIVCKKLVSEKLEESSFIDKAVIDNWYPSKDFHYLYMGEIISIEKN